MSRVNIRCRHGDHVMHKGGTGEVLLRNNSDFIELDVYFCQNCYRVEADAEGRFVRIAYSGDGWFEVYNME